MSSLGLSEHVEIDLASLWHDLSYFSPNWQTKQKQWNLEMACVFTNLQTAVD